MWTNGCINFYLSWYFTFQLLSRWCLFAPEWNETSILLSRAPSLTLTSDTSGEWYCEAFEAPLPNGSRCPGPSSWAETNIAAKELLPVVVGAMLWGNAWRGQHILCCSDNIAVVATINAGAGLHPLLAHLLCCLFFCQAAFNFVCSASHISGSLNSAADALSRNNLPLLLPTGSSLSPSSIPARAAARPKPQWKSPHWARLFKASFVRV